MAAPPMQMVTIAAASNDLRMGETLREPRGEEADHSSLLAYSRQAACHKRTDLLDLLSIT